MGHSIFAKYADTEPEKILRMLEKSDTFEEGQWTVQILAECMKHARIIVVSDEKNRKEMESMGVIFKKAVSDAVDDAIRHSNTAKPEVLVLPKAPYTILDTKTLRRI